MLKSILVANRGEIACRVFRTARALGIRTIAVYSEADMGAVHVQAADEAYLIGPAPALESYLDIEKIISVAHQSGAQAIHPGYGFLSENAAFAQACADADIIFVGPGVSAIQSMGSKMMSKRLMEEAGVPILPGYHGDDQSLENLADEADRVGYPLLIKASAGGGGKGMRLVESADQFADQLAAARREAKAAFGDDDVLLERYLTAPKHIEVQLMADQHGNVVHLFERDCSVQRRHQKVVEEAPGPTISPQLREELGAKAVLAAKKVDYIGAGTVEFIAQGDEFYFMEMNTRLQVEHPVTEAITGLDMVELQLKVASGQPLPVSQDDITLTGHAVEVRLYAENPSRKFLPATGELICFEIPDSIRVDAGVEQGSVVSMHYDPMLAKLIAYGDSRSAAIAILDQALAGCRVAGVEHNLGYLRGLIRTPVFQEGSYTTSIAEDVHADVVPDNKEIHAAHIALSMLQSNEQSVWSANPGFRLNMQRRSRLSLQQGKTQFDVVSGEGVTVNGVGIPHVPQGSVLVSEDKIYSIIQGHTERFTQLTDDLSRYQQLSLSGGGITAPMPGQVIAVRVEVGNKVAAGDELVVVEAMKMEHSVSAPKAGMVKAVFCEAGARVEEGVVLVEVE
ncbi:MAG: biotin carboxylase N-terminal domain-containing protein [Pseudomonadota bacterium]